MTPRELDLLQGTLDVLVLRALSFGSMHGYAVARFIRAGSDGTFKVLDGALYTSLHRMEERGWLEAEWGLSEKGKRAKFYRLTASGRQALRGETAAWHEYVAAVARVLRAVPEAG
jgi:transcriptional regulator